MAKIKVDREKCVGCSICVKECTFGCIKLFDNYPVISEECRLCRACIQACPTKALSMEEGEKEGVDVSEYKGVLIFAEQRDGKILDVAYELLGKGREIADILGETLTAVVLGYKIDKEVQELIAYGADKAYVYDDMSLRDFRDDPYTHAISDLIVEVKPSIFLIGATACGRALAPRISMRMRTGLTADCTSLDIDPVNKLLLQTRPAFGGNVMAKITCESNRPQMATVRPKVMDKPPRDKSREGEIVKKKIPKKLLDRVKIVERVVEDEDVDISEADIIVVGGRGLERKEGFNLVRELAEELGGLVGASRPPVDEGWISYAHQIGLSGKTVRPKVYIAAGVSGAIHHMAGMETADYIIAINKDPDAPIFKIADVGIVGDLYLVIPNIIDAIRELKKSKSKKS